MEFVGSAIVPVGASKSTTTTISLTGLSGGLSSSPTDGDLVIVAYSVAAYTMSGPPAISITDSADSPYSLIDDVVASGKTYGQIMRVASKRMGSTPDTSLKVSPTLASTRAGIVMISVWRDVNISPILDVAVQTAFGDTPKANPPALTPETEGAKIIAFGAGGSVTDPDSYTSGDLTGFQSDYSNDTMNAIGGTGYHDWTSGSFDPAQFGNAGTDTDLSWVALTLALLPAITLVEGALSQTLANATLSATGAVPVSGTLTTTLDDASLSAAGSVLIGGSLDATLDDTGITAAGVAPVAGSADIALDDAGLSATGDVVGDSLNVTLDDTTLSAAGTVAVSGSVTTTLDDASLAAEGESTITGGGSITLADTTLSATAGAATTGALSETLDDATLSASGTVRDVPFPSAAGLSTEAYTTLLIEVAPLDPADGTRKTIRATNLNDHRVTGLNDLIWRPAISENAKLAIRLFKGDFDGTAAPAGGNVSLQVDQLIPQQADVRRFIWVGATVKLWAGRAGDAWPWTQVFDGIVGDNPRSERNRITLPIAVNTEPFDADVLTLTYAGTGDEEGGADLTDKPKPWLLGRCFNVQPVLVNAVDSVFQFSAYGTIQAVSKLYERGSDFGAAVGDYADYDALVAADIPPGRWGTCLAQGMVRLGAPPAGVITGDVDGDKYGGTWRRKTGEIITRVATNAGASAHLDATSLSALDTAVAAVATTNQGRIGVYLTEQESLLDFAARLASPCNAQAGISLMGKLFVSRIAIGSPSVTLDAQQREMPRVTKSVELGTRPPFFRVEMGYARSWRVHSTDEIAYEADLIERGLYKDDEFYREGNIVSEDDGSRWVYINSVPTSGNAPPDWPTTSNAYWDNLSPPLRFQVDARLKPDRVRLPANADGSIISYAPATFEFIAKQTDGVDVSTSFVLSLATGGNPDGLTYTFHNETDPPSVVITGGFSEAEAPGEFTILATGGGDFDGVEFERTFALEIDKTGVMLQQLMTANDQNGETPSDDIAISNVTLKTTHPDGTVTYTADVTWTYDSDPDDPDNFDDLVLIVNASTSSTPVTLGGIEDPGPNERGGRLLLDVTTGSATIEVLSKVDPTKWYTIGLEKFRKVNTNVAAGGYVVGPIEQYGPFRPASTQQASSNLVLSSTDGYAPVLAGTDLILPILRGQNDYGSNQLINPANRRVQLKRYKGSTDVTAGTTWAIAASYNCSATITSGGLLTIAGSNLGQVIGYNYGNAYVQITGTYEGVVQRYLVGLETTLGDPELVDEDGARAMVAANAKGVDGISVSFYGVISDVLRVRTGPVGYLRMAAFYNYSSPAAGTFIPDFKLQYKLASSGTWLDFTTWSGAAVAYDAIYTRKRLAIFMDDQSGFSSDTSYDLRVLAKRNTSGTAAYGDIEGVSFWAQGF